jgi:hypothetical protein
MSKFSPELIYISTLLTYFELHGGREISLMQAESNFCTSCGAKLKPGAKFCSACGTPVGAAPNKNPANAPLTRFPMRMMMRGRIQRLIERFRAKGAVSPDTAMTAQELGLGPRFQMAMSRRLGRLGTFVEVNGKYYLSEERLEAVREQMATRRQW